MNNRGLVPYLCFTFFIKLYLSFISELVIYIFWMHPCLYLHVISCNSVSGIEFYEFSLFFKWFYFFIKLSFFGFIKILKYEEKNSIEKKSKKYYNYHGSHWRVELCSLRTLRTHIVYTYPRNVKHICISHGAFFSGI